MVDEWESVLAGLGVTRQRLGGGSSQEDILLNVEARIEEVIGEIDDPMDIQVFESTDDITVDEIESVVLEATDDVRAETEASPWSLSTSG